VVVDEDKPVGIVTERDLVRKGIIGRLDVHSSIEKVMSSPLITISKNTTLSEATKLMIEKEIRRLPVVENGKLVGIITATDVLNISPRAFEFSKIIDKILKNL
jgi:CBS domain-containing protein